MSPQGQSILVQITRGRSILFIFLARCLYIYIYIYIYICSDIAIPNIAFTTNGKKANPYL